MYHCKARVCSENEMVKIAPVTFYKYCHYKHLPGPDWCTIQYSILPLTECFCVKILVLIRSAFLNQPTECALVHTIPWSWTTPTGFLKVKLNWKMDLGRTSSVCQPPIIIHSFETKLKLVHGKTLAICIMQTLGPQR